MEFHGWLADISFLFEWETSFGLLAIHTIGDSLLMLKALNDRLIIEPEEVQKEEKLDSGIFLAKPDTVIAKEQEAVRKGKVLSVGPGMKTISGEIVIPQVKEGAIICYQPFAKTEIEIKGKTLHIIRWEDVDCEWISDNKTQPEETRTS